MSLICTSSLAISACRNSLRSCCADVSCCNDEVPDADDGRRRRSAATPRPAKNATLRALAPLLPVREQVDQDHCTNLRIARPQAVRYDDASRRSLALAHRGAELHVLERIDDHRREAGQLGDAVLQAGQRGGAAGEHHVVHLVVRRAGEEVLQRAADLLRQAVDERARAARSRSRRAGRRRASSARPPRTRSRTGARSAASAASRRRPGRGRRASRRRAAPSGWWCRRRSRTARPAHPCLRSAAPATTRLIARREACDSMSSTTGFRPAASARPWRSCTRSLRDAAISTSTSPTEVGLGPMTQKSRLTSSSENGMYWLASVSTWSSSSSSRRPAGSMIFLVITADCGIAITTWRGLGAALGDDALDRVGDLVELLDLAVGDPALLEALGARIARARTRRCRSARARPA